MKLKSGQNNLFWGLNGPRKNKKGHVGPTKKKPNIKVWHPTDREAERREVRDFFSFFFFLLSSQIHENLTVGIHRDKHEKCSTRRGLRVGTKNKGFHREFR